MAKEGRVEGLQTTKCAIEPRGESAAWHEESAAGAGQVLAGSRSMRWRRYNGGRTCRFGSGMAGGVLIRDIAEFVESIPYTETREYVQAILRNREIYRALYATLVMRNQGEHLFFSKMQIGQGQNIRYALHQK